MKQLSLFFLALSFPFFVQAQHSWARPYFEVGAQLGTSSYSGELVNSMLDTKHLHFAGGIFARYNLNQYLNFRLQASYGNISGNDQDAKELRNQIRNLHFRSHIFEGALMAEINFMGYHTMGHKKLFSPYAFIGLGVFNYNPKAKHFDPNRDDEWVALQPLATEGQGNPNLPNRTAYELTQLSIPMGLGVKFAIHSHLNIGFEIGFRKTFTDYLDDVSLSYPYDVTTNPATSLYDQTPYDAGQFGNLSEQQLMSDRTYEYLVNQNGGTFGADFPAQDAYDAAVAERGGQTTRGDKAQDWYLITGVTISYNFIDNGLVGSRKRRRKRQGCKSARF